MKRKTERVILRLVPFSKIVKCSHCKKILSVDDFETHKCDLPLNECKTIEVIRFQDCSYEDKKLMNGWGTDGILYTFEVVQRKPIPLILPVGDDFSHGKKKPFGDGDFTEPNAETYRGRGCYWRKKRPKACCFL